MGPLCVFSGSLVESLPGPGSLAGPGPIGEAGPRSPASPVRSDAPISSWAGKRAFGTVHGNVYNGTVHFHLHVGPRTIQGSSSSSKKPRTVQEHAPEVASYLAAIAGKLK